MKLCICLLLQILLPAAFPVGRAVAQTLAIRNVNVVDVNGGPLRQPVNILIERGRIVSVGGKLPPRVNFIEGKGKYLIPGLWDMHVHLWERQPMFELYLSNGITGIRDMGSDFDRTRKWGQEIASGKRSGPRIYTAGSPVDGMDSQPGKFSTVRVMTPDDGRRAADTLDIQGADFIKVMSGVPHDSYIALAQRARLRRAIFAGHVPESITINEAIDARQKSMEHLFGLAIACSSDEDNLRARRAAALGRKDNAELRAIRQASYETYSEAKCRQLFSKLARFNVWQVPTLVLRQRLSFIGTDQLASSEAVQYIPKEVRSGWPDPREELKDISAPTLDHFRQDYEHHAKLVGLMARTGVPILAGTDTGDPYVVPGFSLHHELEALFDAGLSPLQTLQAATIQPARYFGIDATHGSVAKGKVADLVLLDADPIENIRNTRRISAVIVGGKAHYPRKLLAGR